MNKSSISWSLKQYRQMYCNGKISFDYPIQRKGNQWDLWQKSLLIHSLSSDFPVPAFYAIREEQVYYILDGKQRLTTLVDFVENKFALHENTPNANIFGKEYPLAEMMFEELQQTVQDQILSFMLTLYKIDDATDEEIEDMFYRLNNGTPLSKQQKAKAKMGTMWANKIKSLIDHPFMKEKANFTYAQLKRADDETALLQTMMLMDKSYELKGIASNNVVDYTATFKEDEKNKLNLVENILEIMDYLDQVYGEKEKVLTRKVNFPMLLLTAKLAIEEGITVIEFLTWTDEFKQSLKDKGEIETNYKEFSGQGSVKKHKTLGRIEEMQKHFMTYFDLEPSNQKEGEVNELHE